MPTWSNRKVKIVCTIGPASQSLEMLRKLMKTGLDVARMNFSHGDHEFHRKTLENIRKAASLEKKIVGAMQDLQGPKIRAGKLPAEGIELRAGDIVVLYPEGAVVKSSPKGRILLPISRDTADPISKSVSKGAKILFDDGKICTQVVSVSAPEIIIEVEVGGKLTSHKGMNLPGTPLPIPALTDKDLLDMKFGLSIGVDAIALSFVRSSEDMEYAKKLIRKYSNHRPLLIAKMEREEAIQHQEAIIDSSDGILVARGDMAVEVGAERVPVIQKQLIHACTEIGVPVITATQMLESMVSTPTPTRAEASDVANAVFDGTDAVMLSAETASGQYPVETVEIMSRIILEAERYAFSNRPEVLPMPGSVVDSVEFSASRIAQHVGAVAIACLTHSGTAARTLSKFRPKAPIVAIMDREEILRKLAFVWGVQGEIIPNIVGTDDLFVTVEQVLQKHGWAEHGDQVVVTAGVPTLRRGTTNMVKVHRVGSARDRKVRKVT